MSAELSAASGPRVEAYPEFMHLTGADLAVIRNQNRYLTAGAISCGVLLLTCLILGLRILNYSPLPGVAAMLGGLGAAIWAWDRVMVHACTPYRKLLTEPKSEAATRWLARRYNLGLEHYAIFELLLGREGSWERPTTAWAGTVRHHGTIYPPGQPDGLRFTYSVDCGYRVVNARSGAELPRWDLPDRRRASVASIC